MNKNDVAVVRFDEPRESVRRAVALSRGLDHLPARAKVFIKPNIVFWTHAVPFPKWGVVSTSRVVEDIVVLLKGRGIDDITIGEGTVTIRAADRQTADHAFETLGYGVLKRKYGVRSVNIFERPFRKVDVGDGFELSFNADAMDREMIAVKGCPPEPKELFNALRRAGILADPGWFEKMDQLPGRFYRRYAGRPEFEEGHFRVRE